MNSEPLTSAHGSPVRVVLPGVTGARWVKAVAEISVRSAASESPWHTECFRMLGPGEAIAHVASAPAIYDMPVQSAMVTPRQGDVVKHGVVQCSGYAYGGRSVQRVDVSVDGGFSWTQAELQEPAGDWCWVLWRANVQLPPPTTGEYAYSICCKAVSGSGDTQPETLRGVANPLLLLNNSWHTVRLHATPEDGPSSVQQSIAAGDLLLADDDGGVSAGVWAGHGGGWPTAKL
eukprot:TRINITY_DN6532_c1_g4_i1.p2 TRINITY_DN6532_c1_g4~~TRINITY_DN6532_c1_g4_i1.p2  ORF type:complete len:232 (+),score=47.90 TRINITY_DN6532_c1_g4_i1:535-1230(+)